MALHLAALLTLWASPHPARGQEPPQGPDDLTGLSLEELMDVEVTIASRGREQLHDAPAAVYVLTNDELRRSGAQSIQEALRMVPGFLVGHWSNTLWDATSRGFTSAFNHNILVMVDGANVDTLTSPEGVQWHLQEIDLADVERIEVVRGPGAALWGNNAVNGVINVVTRHARDTQGWQAVGTLGTEMSKGALRYGDTLGEHGWFRTWAVGSQHDALSDYSSGAEIHNNDWWIARGGFRGDWELEGGAALMLQVSAFDGEKEQNYRVDLPSPPYADFVNATTPERGGSVTATLERPDSDGDLDRFVFSYLRHNKDRVDYHTLTDILDLDWQRRSPLGADNVLTCGLGWRFAGWTYDGDFSLNHKPNQGTLWTVRAFALDELEFPGQDLRVMFGAEAELNDLTGSELQPTLRAIWDASERQQLWAAISRAVRTPSLTESYDYSQQVGSNPNDVYLWRGNQDLQAEEVLATELGWRWRIGARFSLDVVAFYDSLDSVVTSEDGAPYTSGGINYTPFTYGNKGSAESWGVEVGADAVLTPTWHLRAALTHYEQRNEADASSTDPLFELNDHIFPQTIANLRSYCDLGSHWELDCALYYVDTIHLYGTPPYLRGDLRLGYNPSPDWRFSLGLQNACDPTHPEDGGDQVPRNVWIGVAWSQ